MGFLVELVLFIPKAIMRGFIRLGLWIMGA